MENTSKAKSPGIPKTLILISLILVIIVEMVTLYRIVTSKDTGELVDIQTDDLKILSEIPEGKTTDKAPNNSNDKVETRKATIDYSTASDGYIMVYFKQDSETKLKFRVTGEDEITYTYNIHPKEWTIFPLSAGNGEYEIQLYQETTNNKYAIVAGKTVEVTLKDEFRPFIAPNQYVNYENATNTVEKADELIGDKEGLEAVAAIYDFVIDNISYDKEKAETVEPGYLPDLDKVLENKKGICFDYASLMTAMLRSKGIPCKLIVGYAGTAYHAWVSVWTKESGWIDKAIFFNGTKWQRMDPTFASTGNESNEIMKYIRDDTNYQSCYIY